MSKEDNSYDYDRLLDLLAGNRDTSSSFNELAQDESASKLLKIWQISGLNEENASFDTEAQLSTLKKRLSLDETEDTSSSTNTSSPTSTRIIFWPMGIAASILLAVALFWLFNQDEPIPDQVFTSQNKVLEQTLPDGSETTLNSNTTLTVMQQFQGKERKVELKGEGYFKVQHNQDKPFRIETWDATVTVLGTEFNVVANDDQPTEVYVKSGRVSVQYNDIPEPVILEKGESVTLNESREIQKFEEAQYDNQLYWKTRILTFDQMSLTDVVVVLEEAYNTKIVLQGDNLGNCKLTTTLNNQTIGTVINIIAATFALEIMEGDNEITLTGEGC